MIIELYGCFYKFGVLFVGAFRILALLFGILGPSNSWKLPPGLLTCIGVYTHIQRREVFFDDCLRPVGSVTRMYMHMYMYMQIQLGMSVCKT